MYSQTDWQRSNAQLIHKIGRLMKACANVNILRLP
jgi:hypothetical protein